MKRLQNALFAPYDNSDWLLTTLARFVFAAVLLVYFWNSGLTKLGESYSGLFEPSFNAFAQIFPRAAEAVSYDISQATQYQRLVILIGTWAEFVLPALILIGLFTRIAAIGMIVFIAVQSVTDIIGHASATGAWFDNLATGTILDQRALWFFLLLFLVAKGAGPFSIDRFFTPRSMVY